MTKPGRESTQAGLLEGVVELRLLHIIGNNVDEIDDCRSMRELIRVE